MLLLSLCSCHLGNLRSNPLVPISKTFKSRTDLAKSSFWRSLVQKCDRVTENTTSIYIEDDQTVYFFNASAHTGATKRDIVLVQLQLGNESQVHEIVNYPLVTISAEYSTSELVVERELSSGYDITLSLSSSIDLTVLETGVTASLGYSYTFSGSLSESIICRAAPGGMAQLQATTYVKHYPAARTRQVTYKYKDGLFQDGKWDGVVSEVQNESYEGALFYVGGPLSTQRCVTDRKYFEDERKWLVIKDLQG